MGMFTIVCGQVLVLLGVIAYVVSDMVSLTALIPTVFGIILTLCGALALKEGFRMHAMHAAVLIALLGLFGSINGIPGAIAVLQGEVVERPIAKVAQAIMAITLMVYLVTAIRSFVQARIARKSAA